MGHARMRKGFTMVSDGGARPSISVAGWVCGCQGLGHGLRMERRQDEREGEMGLASCMGGYTSQRGNWQLQR